MWEVNDWNKYFFLLYTYTHCLSLEPGYHTAITDIIFSAITAKCLHAKSYKFEPKNINLLFIYLIMHFKFKSVSTLLQAGGSRAAPKFAVIFRHMITFCMLEVSRCCPCAKGISLLGSWRLSIYHDYSPSV